MLKSERQKVISERIRKNDFVSIEELTLLLETSESTVRRDLDELEAKNQLVRIHGGAKANKALVKELTFSQKSIKNVQEKQRLGQKAAALIEENDVVFFDAGTTIDCFIDQITSQSLTAVTNSIHHATKLTDKDIDTYIIGGFVKKTTDASVGTMAIEQLRMLNFDKAFIGANGVDSDYITTPSGLESFVKKQAIHNAKKTYVLADSSKLGQKSFMKIGRVEEVILITNKSDDDLLEKIKRKAEVIEV